ncbi:hypothetical protein Acr_11g0005310 [Actinidia rufa]|uniref:DNA topoisomerase (ATP-hydrolyzing) n=1 Tax=Actinidia rufa TaxID=165716 RepID=A0A7J0FC22_9ERIC|nr:hypothetical protein Acr_11g0005310 [Actinidia rufa]
MGDYKSKREQKKADAAKRQRITGIPKLEDAGGPDSQKCSLILTEGDSAKALANEDANEAMVEEGRMRMQRKVGMEVAVKLQERSTEEPTPESSSVPEVLKRKGRAKTHNSATKKPPLADTNKDVEVLQLKEQLVVYNSPQYKQQTNKSSTGTAAEINNIVTETKDSESDCLIIQGTTGEEKTYGDNMDVNEKFEQQIASATKRAMKGVGNHASKGMEIKPNTSERKRATSNKPQQEAPSKELSSNGVKPVKSTGVSPERKVRKTSTSPFSKNSG